jgi:hypothetical protein
MSTATEELIAAKTEVAAAEAKLQEARDKAAGITRMKREDWDTLTDNQKSPLIPQLKARTLILED